MLTRAHNATKKAPAGAFFRQCGFTLVEVVAVLVIVGVISAVAAPRLFDNAVFVERGFADELAASVRYARRIAVASSCNVRFTVNSAGYSAVQPTVRCNTAGAWGVNVQSPDRRILTNAPPAGVALGAAVIEFSPNGELVNPVAPVSVGAFSVTVATTGAVTVQ